MCRGLRACRASTNPAHLSSSSRLPLRSKVTDYESNTTLPASAAKLIHMVSPGTKRVEEATWIRQRIWPD